MNTKYFWRFSLRNASNQTSSYFELNSMDATIEQNAEEIYNEAKKRGMDTESMPVNVDLAKQINDDFAK